VLEQLSDREAEAEGQDEILKESERNMVQLKQQLGALYADYLAKVLGAHVEFVCAVDIHIRVPVGARIHRNDRSVEGGTSTPDPRKGWFETKS
jgi:hypothetical protein